MNKTINELISNYSNKKGYHQNFVSFVCMSLIICLLLTILYILVFYFIGSSRVAITLGISCILLIGPILLFKSKLNISIIVNAYLLIYSFGLLYSIMEYGGINSPILPCLICTPYLATLILKKIELLAWVIIIAITVSVISYHSSNNSELISLIVNEEVKYIIYIIINIGIISTVLSVTYFYWKFMQKEDDKEIEKDIIYLEESDINYFILNWNFIKSKLYEKFPKILEEIDQLHFLTDHEKKYALIKHFRLDINILTDKMNVSKRTIETNLYRVRLKMKKNNIDPNTLEKKT